MANRIVGNWVIVDSAMNNVPLFGPGSSINLSITGIAFAFGNTSAVCVFTGANTTDVLCRFQLIVHNTDNLGSTVLSNFEKMNFSPPLNVPDLKIPTLTAGTAWVYLS